MKNIILLASTMSICSPEVPEPIPPVEECETAWMSCPNDSACPNGRTPICEWDSCLGYTGGIRCEDRTGYCPPNCPETENPVLDSGN